MEGQLPKKKIPTLAERAKLLEGEQHLIIERPQPHISTITINRPSQNLLTHRTRAQLINQLQTNDQDPDVRVTIIKGAGGNFCSGHDFDTNREEILPLFEPEIDGQTSRHVLNGWLLLNDLAKPIIAQVEGEAIGMGLELAAACDICICAENAIIGYGPIRGQGLADYQILPWMCGMRNAMELVLTNSSMSGIEAAEKNFATEAVPVEELEQRTMDLALRIAKIPSDLLAFNKKSVHRAFEAQGMRTNLRNGVDLEALMFKAPGAKMLTARRGPQRGVPTAHRVPPPRPSIEATPPAVAVQAVSAKSENAKLVVGGLHSPKATGKSIIVSADTPEGSSSAPGSSSKSSPTAKPPTLTKPASSLKGEAIKATPMTPPATKSSVTPSKMQEKHGANEKAPVKKNDKFDIANKAFRNQTYSFLKEIPKCNYGNSRASKESS